LSAPFVIFPSYLPAFCPSSPAASFFRRAHPPTPNSAPRLLRPPVSFYLDRQLFRRRSPRTIVHLAVTLAGISARVSVSSRVDSGRGRTGARGTALSATSSAGDAALNTENNGATWKTRRRTASEESYVPASGFAETA